MRLSAAVAAHLAQLVRIAPHKFLPKQLQPFALLVTIHHQGQLHAQLVQQDIAVLIRQSFLKPVHLGIIAPLRLLSAWTVLLDIIVLELHRHQLYARVDHILPFELGSVQIVQRGRMLQRKGNRHVECAPLVIMHHLVEL